MQFHSLDTAAPLLAALAASLVDEDPPHGCGRSSKEMSPITVQTRHLTTDQPQVGLVHQGSGVKRLARLFMGHLLGGQLTQFIVDERKELLRGVRIATLNGG